MNALSVEGLSALLGEAGIALPEGAIPRLVRHAEEMLRWNRSIRLTAITAPLEVAVKHILDSLMLLSFAPFPGRTMDFGSGGGYPGIPLAIALPDARLVLLESTAKKCAFLSHACAMLQPLHAEALRGRLDPRKILPIGRFERIVTRATLAPRDAARLLLPYLSPGGRLLLMTGSGEGPGAAPELPAGARYGRRMKFALPHGMGEREIREVLAGL
ncbi:MAG: 16S rRNA (guanine(527)-N(7))-methyltransferase RsmG [Deltaproteobacteria bacterium]|nr:MAG: 16S rRNA (guanine(527)-N(7))-methyltransferase RsmG [Deltaproteobacteria bacterium]